MKNETLIHYLVYCRQHYHEEISRITMGDQITTIYENTFWNQNHLWIQKEHLFAYFALAIRNKNTIFVRNTKALAVLEFLISKSYAVCKQCILEFWICNKIQQKNLPNLIFRHLPFHSPKARLFPEQFFFLAPMRPNLIIIVNVK